MTTPDAGRVELIAAILRGLTAYAPDEVSRYGPTEAAAIADAVMPLLTAQAETIRQLQSASGLLQVERITLSERVYDQAETIRRLEARVEALDEAHGRMMAERDRWHEISRKTMEALCEIESDVHIGYDGDEVAYAQSVVHKIQQLEGEVARLRDDTPESTIAEAAEETIRRLRGDVEILQRLYDDVREVEDVLFGIKDRPPGKPLHIARWLIGHYLSKRTPPPVS